MLNPIISNTKFSWDHSHVLMISNYDDIFWDPDVELQDLIDTSDNIIFSVLPIASCINSYNCFLVESDILCKLGYQTDKEWIVHLLINEQYPRLPITDLTEIHQELINNLNYDMKILFPNSFFVDSSDPDFHFLRIYNNNRHINICNLITDEEKYKKLWIENSLLDVPVLCREDVTQNKDGFFYSELFTDEIDYDECCLKDFKIRPEMSLDIDQIVNILKDPLISNNTKDTFVNYLSTDIANWKHVLDCRILNTKYQRVMQQLLVWLLVHEKLNNFYPLTSNQACLIETFDDLQIETISTYIYNLYYLNFTTNYESKSLIYKPVVSHGISDQETITKRLNLFLTGTTDDVLAKLNWTNMAIVGSALAACCPKYDYSDMLDFFNEKYYLSDIDLCCNHDTFVDYIYHVTETWKTLGCPEFKIIESCNAHVPNNNVSEEDAYLEYCKTTDCPVNKENFRVVITNNEYVKYYEQVKFRFTIPKFRVPIEMFHCKSSSFSKIVSRFHLGCVRSWWTNETCFMLPSAVVSYLTMINYDYNYFSDSKTFFEILEKYTFRGYATMINSIEYEQIIIYMMYNNSNLTKEDCKNHLFNSYNISDY